MSGQALIWAANVRGLKPATKIVLIQLAERHNKDTGLCNPSIKTLAEDCEMDRTTVMRHIEVLEGLGLITTQTAGNQDGGRANNQYLLHMPTVEPTDVSRGVKSDFATGVKSQSDGGLSRNPTGVKSHSCATLTLREPVEEPNLFGSIEPQSKARDEKVAQAFDRFWKVYPKKVGKPKSLQNFRSAVKAGSDPEAIIAGATVYADLMAGKEATYIKNPEGWITARRWEDEDLQPRDDEAARRRRRLMGPQFGEIVR